METIELTWFFDARLVRFFTGSEENRISKVSCEEYHYPRIQTHIPTKQRKITMPTSTRHWRHTEGKDDARPDGAFADKNIRSAMALHVCPFSGAM